MKHQINIEKLSAAVKEERMRLRKGLRCAGKQSGISYPSLSRIERGGIPALNTFFKLCNWLNIRAEEFIEVDGKTGYVAARELELNDVLSYIRGHEKISSEGKDLINSLILFTLKQ